MIPDNQIKEFRKALLNSARPLIFFDDDADGLSSFLQFYKLNPESKGVLYKVAGPLDTRFLKKIKEYGPDLVLILDIPEVSQDFLDKAGKVYWLDHHGIQNKKNVKYANPMIQSKGKDNRPTSYWAHKICKTSIWLSMVGCVGDWFIPEDLRQEFDKEYSDLLSNNIKEPDDALFESDIGKIAKMFNFLLKGQNKDAMSSVKVLTRIKDPYELINNETAQAKYLWKKFNKMNIIYENLISSVKVDDSPLLLFNYTETRTSLTSELSNELQHRYPDKFIIISRQNNGEYKCSLRSVKHKVRDILKKALKTVNGFGGGHLHACGCNVRESDWQEFLNNIRQEL